MSKFRKKPVIIEAYQTTKERFIDTLEGKMKAVPGDWIITGIKGEQYPCKPDIFEKTYEPCDETSNVLPNNFTIAEAAEQVRLWKNNIEIDTFDKLNEIYEGKQNVLVDYKGKEMLGTVETITEKHYTIYIPELDKKITKRL